MIRAQRRFADRRRPLVKRQRIGISALPFIEISQIVERARHIRMLASEHFLTA
jgi:hypothetical protein